MNQHREIMYARRRLVLKKDSLKDDLIPLFEAEFHALIEGATDTQTEILDLEQLEVGVRDVIPLERNWASKQESRDTEELVKQFMKEVEELYRQRYMEFNDEGVMVIERLVSLKTIDSLWLEHLETMEHLRDGIGLRGYAQRDPLVEYKQEAFRLFSSLQRKVDSEIVHTLFKVRVELTQDPSAAPPPIETEITTAAATAVGIGSDETGKTVTEAQVKAAVKASERGAHAAGPIRRSEAKPTQKKKAKKKKRR
jgi:preprotein translocase subunit SecA